MPKHGHPPRNPRTPFLGKSPCHVSAKKGCNNQPTREEVGLIVCGNDIFPFTRDELQEVDPEGCALIARLWETAAL